MPNHLTNPTSSLPGTSRPSSSSRDISLAAAVAGNGRAHELLVTEIQAIHDRRRELASSLTGGNRTGLAETISGLLRSFPRRDSGDQDAAMTVAGYVAAVEPLPLWAVQDAAASWIRSSVPHAWPPTPSELYAAAKALCLPFWAELSKLERATEQLAAEPPPKPAAAPPQPQPGRRLFSWGEVPSGTRVIARFSDAEFVKKELSDAEEAALAPATPRTEEAA